MGHFHWWSWLAFSLFCKSALCAQELILDYQEIKILSFIPNSAPSHPPPQGFSKIQLCYWHSPSPASRGKCLYQSVKASANLSSMSLEDPVIKTQIWCTYSQLYWTYSNVLLLCGCHTCDNLFQETGRGTLFVYSCKISGVGFNFSWILS